MEPVTVTVADARKALGIGIGIGNTKIYELMNAGKLEAVHIGRVRVPSLPRAGR